MTGATGGATGATVLGAGITTTVGLVSYTLFKATPIKVYPDFNTKVFSRI